MPLNRRSMIQAITDPTRNFLSFFLVGTLLFGLFADGVSSLVWDILPQWVLSQTSFEQLMPVRIVILTLLLGMILGVVYGTDVISYIRGYVSRLGLIPVSVPDVATVNPLDGPCAGLVVIMSMRAEGSPAEQAIRWHWNQGHHPHVRHCWVIATESSLPYAEILHQRLIADGVCRGMALYYGPDAVPDLEQPGQSIGLVIPDDQAQDPDTLLRLVNGIYADATDRGLDESDLIVDFTGGTKPMGVGAFLACAQPHRRTEYLSQTKDPIPLEIQVAYRVQANH